MEKIWLEKAYPSGMAAEINPDEYSSIAAMFDKYVDVFADKNAYINMGKTITYRELNQKAKAFAAYLQQELGLKKGDKFAIMIPNTLQYPIALFGALLAGLTVVNVNPLYTARELKHQLNDSDAKAILIIENFAHVLEQVIDSVHVHHIILTSLGDCLPFIKGSVVNFVVKYVKKIVPSFQLKNTLRFNHVLAQGSNLTFTSVTLTGDDLAFLQYTGGTTGEAKGAMLTHRNMVANLVQAKAMLKTVLKDGEETVVTALPLYHIFALTANCLLFMTIGGTNLLITNPRDMASFVKELEKHKFTALTGVNTLFNGLLNSKGFANLNFSHLKLVLGGGMAVQQSVAELWHKVTGVRLLEAYGLTECAPLVTMNPYNQMTFNGSIGVPAPSTDIKIVGENGEELAIGEIGEFWVKGPQVMKGYYKREAATNEVIKDGWLDTGDIAKVDENGFVKLVDRKKDMIIVSGFNVYPNEIEDVIMLHKGVLEVAAIGVSNGATGEAVKVFIVKKDPALSEIDIVKHCKENLTNYKIPKLIEFRTELPKSNVGKILRRELRDKN